MSTLYNCADCEHQFSVYEASDDSRCPRCGRTEAVEPADDSPLQSDIWRQWLIVFAVLFVAGIAYLVYQ